MSLTPLGLSLRDFYTSESTRIEADFARTSDGRQSIHERARLVDQIIFDLCKEYLDADPNSVKDLCLVALGGYGRRALFPYSDIDLMFLSETDETEKHHRDAARAISRTLWDLRLRLSPTNRMMAECATFHRDNAEFNISLLDSRFLAGDARLFDRLHGRALPQMIARQRSELLRDISELTQQRHQKEGDTIFHLEPNIKNTPGGLRDYHVACWVSFISRHDPYESCDEPESLWAPKTREEMARAFDFLAAARCFLHFRQGRDDNGLSYELQAEAAARGIGAEPGRAVDPADWMRLYFRHARTVYGLSTQLLDEALPVSLSIRARLDHWISHRPPSDFLVVGGRVRLRRPDALTEPTRLLQLFEFISREGVKLSRETEAHIHEALPAIKAALEAMAAVDERAVGPAMNPGDSLMGRPALWEHLRRILMSPYAADALRAMHSSGLLVQLFPKFAAIDLLVIRDFYHHYTVDAHSFRAIENIHRLRHTSLAWEKPFAELFLELETPDLLFLSLLFHDVGKGMPGDNHVVGSLDALERIFPRLDLKPADADTVRFLIRDHLAMSANLMRRDIFDPRTIRVFAENVGTPERLKLLCLFTYADIRAVNPEALTPWKAESLWQFYVSTANYMSRSLDEERLHTQSGDAQFVERLLPLLGSAARATIAEGLQPGSVARQELSAFLEGLPRRYILAHSPEEVATHFEMARELARKPVDVRIEKRDHLYVLTLLAIDRPLLFVGLSGTLASWGMNIWKAEAFANAGAVVVDTFYFTDPHKTLALNPTEVARLQKNIVDVLSGSVSLENFMRGRSNFRTARPPKVSVPPEIHFDDESSTHSTVMEIVTQDRPGLLYRVSSALAAAGCNIEVALIDTEGQRALDAFYLTINGTKLGPADQQNLREALLRES